MNTEELLRSAHDAYDRIVAAGEPAKELEKAICEHPKGVSQDDYQGLLNHCDGAGLIGQYVSSNLSMLARLNLDVGSFYERLWEVIASNGLLADERERVIALFFVLVSQALPYFKLPLTRMDSDEFRERQEGLSAEINKVRHIILRDFDQATEEASAIIEVLEQQKDVRNRTVLMATYILMHGE